MRESQEPAYLREFLCQDFEKKLKNLEAVKRRTQPLSASQRSFPNGHLKGWVLSFVSTFLCCLFLSACLHTSADILPEPEITTWVFDADEKIILRAITQVLKDRGYGDAHVEAEKNRLETDYVVQGDWRTKVVASVKKLNRQQREVTLSVITEEKSSKGWELKKIMKKEQYEKFFNEFEMQIYQEWSRGK
jgi:hypothetical protein